MLYANPRGFNVGQRFVSECVRGVMNTRRSHNGWHVGKLCSASDAESRAWVQLHEDRYINIFITKSKTGVNRYIMEHMQFVLFIYTCILLKNNHYSGESILRSVFYSKNDNCCRLYKTTDYVFHQVELQMYIFLLCSFSMNWDIWNSIIAIPCFIVPSPLYYHRTITAILPSYHHPHIYMREQAGV